MTVYWQPLHRSVRIEGKAEKVPKEESIKYFHERPRDSQISAKASPQSQRIPDRATLKNWEAEVKAQLKDGEEVPIPNWGGYLIRPHAIEFWQGQSNRLHDRIRFICGEDAEKVSYQTDSIEILKIIILLNLLSSKLMAFLSTRVKMVGCMNGWLRSRFMGYAKVISICPIKMCFHRLSICFMYYRRRWIFLFNSLYFDF